VDGRARYVEAPDALELDEIRRDHIGSVDPMPAMSSVLKAVGLKLAVCEQPGNGQPEEANRRSPQFAANKKKSQLKHQKSMLPGGYDDKHQRPASVSAPHGKAPVAASDNVVLLRRSKTVATG